MLRGGVTMESVLVQVDSSHDQKKPRRRLRKAPGSLRKIVVGLVLLVLLLGVYANLSFFASQLSRSQQNLSEQQTQPPSQTKSAPQRSSADPEVESKLRSVKQSFLHAWNNYWSRCRDSDELDAVTGRCENWVSPKGMVMTAVDSLDTLSIMGLEQEFRQAVQLVLEKLDLKQDHFVSLFETNIRVLGGLLVGYEISQEQGLLDKAKELGDALMKGFDPSSGIPHALVNLHTGETRDFNWNMGHSLLAEIGTLQLEFAALSKHTKNPSYRERSLEIFDKIIQFSQDGLSDIYFSTSSGRPSNRHTTLGAMGDSYYEYLLKVYLYLGRSSTKLKDAYIQAMNSIIDRLTVKTSDGLAFVSELHSGSSLGNKMDHLTCFLPGVLALGVDQEVVQGDLARKHLKAAEDIALTCAEMYLKMPTGLAPETFEKGPNGITAGSARYYLLRPETVESLFVLWRVTHKSIYREKAWAIFNGIEKSCRTNMGYAPVTDVTNPSAPKRGKMESFLLAETFKYLYLIFADDSVIPLSDYVFNTEAHPFKLD